MRSLSIIALMITLTACGGNSTAGSETRTPDADERSAETQTPEFDGEAARELVAMQLAPGPRVPGSEAHRATADTLIAILRDLGCSPHTQDASATLPDGTTIPIHNILASLHPEKTRRVLLLAHYDTRPVADQDPDESRRHTPIPGANDGASGVAVIVQLIKHLSAIPKDSLPVGVDILLTDAEDSGQTAPEGADMQTVRHYEDSWALGAQHFAAGTYPFSHAPMFAILLDMVGAPGATFTPEYYSLQSAPRAVELVRRAATACGHASTFPPATANAPAINDDHLPLIRAGIPSIDIIHTTPDGFPPTWHTVADNLDAISTATLQAVGQTLYQLITITLK